MLYEPIYNPKKSYQENFDNGPFGAFADTSFYTNQGLPGFSFLGQKVYSPFGVAAGPLVNGRFVTAALKKGFDICTYKTVRSAQYPCNPMPNVVAVSTPKLTLEQSEQGVMLEEGFKQPLTITNSFGVPSWSPDFWQEDLSRAVVSAGEGQVVIGSFQGTPKGSSLEYIKDFATCAKLVKETGAKILEVNLSCPNEGTAHLLCFDIDRVRQVVEAIKNEIGNTPLIIKLAYFKDQFLLENFIDYVGNKVDGIEAINSMMSRIIDANDNPGFPDGRKFSGICGSGVRWAGLEMTDRLKKLRQKKDLKFAIIGVGGVGQKTDVDSYIAAGADAVMAATGMMWNPYLAQEIKR